MKCLVFNGWAAGLETWELCTFRHDWIFSYLEQLDGLPARVMSELDEFVLVGFSMGGTMMMRLVPEFAEKVRGLVLISTTPRMKRDVATGWAGMSDRRVEALRLGTRLAFRDDPSPLYEEANLDRGLQFLRETDIRETIEQGTFSRRYPVAVFHSERDGLVVPANVLFWKQAFPQATVTMIPGGEHVLPVTVPELIDAAVTTMLGDND